MSRCVIPNFGNSALLHCHERAAYVAKMFFMYASCVCTVPYCFEHTVFLTKLPLQAAHDHVSGSDSIHVRSLVAAALLRREQRASTSLSRATELLTALASLEWEALSPIGADTAACAAAADSDAAGEMLEQLVGATPAKTHTLLYGGSAADENANEPPHLLRPGGVQHELVSVTLPALPAPAPAAAARPSAACSTRSCVPTAEAVLTARQREGCRRPLGVALVPGTAHVPLQSTNTHTASSKHGDSKQEAAGAVPLPVWLGSSAEAFASAQESVRRKRQGRTQGRGEKRPRGVLGGVNGDASACPGSATISAVLGHAVSTAGSQRHALAAAVVGLELEQASKESAPVSRGDVFYSMSAAFRLGDCGTALATGLADQEVRWDALLARNTPSDEQAPSKDTPSARLSTVGTKQPVAGQAGDSAAGASAGAGAGAAAAAADPAAGAADKAGSGPEGKTPEQKALATPGEPGAACPDAQSPAVVAEEAALGADSDSDDEGGAGGGENSPASGQLPPGVASIGCARDVPEVGALPLGTPFAPPAVPPRTWSQAGWEVGRSAAAPGWPAVDDTGTASTGAEGSLACLPGVRVTTVIAGSQAGMAGQLRPNDVIVAIRVQGKQVWGVPVSPPEQLWSVSAVSRILAAARTEGQTVKLTLARPVPLLLLEAVVRGRTPHAALYSRWVAERAAGAERNLWLSAPGESPPPTPPAGAEEGEGSNTPLVGVASVNSGAVQRTSEPVHPHVALRDSELGTWLRSQLGVGPGLNIPLADMSPPSPPWLMLAAHSPAYSPCAAHMLTPAPRGAHEPVFPPGQLEGGKPGSQPARHLHAARVMHHLQHAPQGGEWQRRYQLVVSQRGVMPLPVQLLANVALYGTPFAHVHFNRVMPLFSIPAVAEGVFHGGQLGVGSYSMAQLGVGVMRQAFPYSVPESNMLEHLDALIRSLRTQSTWNGIAASARSVSVRQEPLQNVPGCSWAQRGDMANYARVALGSITGQVSAMQLPQLRAQAIQADLATATAQSAAQRVMPPLLGERAAPMWGHWNAREAPLPWLGAVAVAVQGANAGWGDDGDAQGAEKALHTGANVWASLLFSSIRALSGGATASSVRAVTRQLLSLPMLGAVSTPSSAPQKADGCEESAPGAVDDAGDWDEGGSQGGSPRSPSAQSQGTAASVSPALQQAVVGTDVAAAVGCIAEQLLPGGDFVQAALGGGSLPNRLLALGLLTLLAAASPQAAARGGTTGSSAQDSDDEAGEASARTPASAVQLAPAGGAGALALALPASAHSSPERTPASSHVTCLTPLRSIGGLAVLPGRSASPGASGIAALPASTVLSAMTSCVVQVTAGGVHYHVSGRASVPESTLVLSISSLRTSLAVDEPLTLQPASSAPALTLPVLYGLRVKHDTQSPGCVPVHCAVVGVPRLPVEAFLFPLPASGVPALHSWDKQSDRGDGPRIAGASAADASLPSSGLHTSSKRSTAALQLRHVGSTRAGAVACHAIVTGVKHGTPPAGLQGLVRRALAPLLARLPARPPLLQHALRVEGLVINGVLSRGGVFQQQPRVVLPHLSQAPVSASTGPADAPVPTPPDTGAAAVEQADVTPLVLALQAFFLSHVQQEEAVQAAAAAVRQGQGAAPQGVAGGGLLAQPLASTLLCEANPDQFAAGVTPPAVVAQRCGPGVYAGAPRVPAQQEPLPEQLGGGDFPRGGLPQMESQRLGGDVCTIAERASVGHLLQWAGGNAAGGAGVRLRREDRAMGALHPLGEAQASPVGLSSVSADAGAWHVLPRGSWHSPLMWLYLHSSLPAVQGPALDEAQQRLYFPRAGAMGCYTLPGDCAAAPAHARAPAATKGVQGGNRRKLQVPAASRPDGSSGLDAMPPPRPRAVGRKIAPPQLQLGSWMAHRLLGGGVACGDGGRFAKMKGGSSLVKGGASGLLAPPSNRSGDAEDQADAAWMSHGAALAAAVRAPLTPIKGGAYAVPDCSKSDPINSQPGAAAAQRLALLAADCLAGNATESQAKAVLRGASAVTPPFMPLGLWQRAWLSSRDVMGASIAAAQAWWAVSHTLRAWQAAGDGTAAAPLLAAAHGVLQRCSPSAVLHCALVARGWYSLHVQGGSTENAKCGKGGDSNPAGGAKKRARGSKGASTAGDVAAPKAKRSRAGGKAGKSAAATQAATAALEAEWLLEAPKGGVHFQVQGGSASPWEQLPQHIVSVVARALVSAVPQLLLDSASS